MKCQDTLYQKIGEAFTLAVPSATSKQSVVFYDHGLFRTRDRDTSDRYLKELFRYDQVADAMNKVEDAATGGLAEYSRRADTAEAMI